MVVVGINPPAQGNDEQKVEEPMVDVQAILQQNEILRQQVNQLMEEKEAAEQMEQNEHDMSDGNPDPSHVTPSRKLDFNPQQLAAPSVMEEFMQFFARQLSATKTGQEPQKTALRAEDKHLQAIAMDGEAFPLFDKTTGISAEQALRDGRRAWMATSYQPLSEWAKKAIRSGKLVHIGVVVPSKLEVVTGTNKSVKDALGTDAGLLLSASGSVQVVKSKNVAAPVESMDDFVRTILGHIFPALIDRPQALSSWFSLARSVVELNHTYGWAVASAFLEQTLAEKVTMRQEDTVLHEVDDAVLRNATAAAPSSSSTPANVGNIMARQTGAAAAAPSSAGSNPQQQACWNWNSGKGCKAPAGQQCRFAHICRTCGGSHRQIDSSTCSAAVPTKRGTPSSSPSSVTSSGGGSGTPSRKGVGFKSE